jgi:PAS domain S-box-containing protein
METPLRLLLIEDSESDAALLIRHLEKGGYAVISERIETAEQLESALQEQSWDIIISDYQLPGFDASAALALFTAKGTDIPFIVVSGTIGEETAVSIMKAGAQDYLMKNNLAKLPSVVKRELAEARHRKELKEAEEQLRLNEQRWKFAIEGSNDGMWDWNVQTNAMYLSPRWKEMLGFDDDEIPNHYDEWYNRVHPDDIEKKMEKIHNHFRHETSLYIIELRLLCKDGSYKWFLARGKVLVWDSAGKPLRMVGTHADITERKQAEEEIRALNNDLERRVRERTARLMELDKEKNELLGIVAHDLRNPLAGIRIHAEIIELFFATNEKILKHAIGIMASVDEMTELINLLLDGHRIESGAFVPHLSRISLSILPHFIERYHARAAAKNIVIDYEPSPHELFVLSDESALSQILDNLISNAVKYSPFGKRIRIHLQERLHEDNSEGTNIREKRKIIRFAIQDEGPGLSEGDKARLFGKFVRLSARPTGGESSTGLGLSIVKKLVEMQKGRVWCESELGKGATFFVELPSAS